MLLVWKQYHPNVHMGWNRETFESLTLKGFDFKSLIFFEMQNKSNHQTSSFKDEPKFRCRSCLGCLPNPDCEMGCEGNVYSFIDA